ncbi:N-acetylmuramoyl-L-alanine amidase, partial [Pediococcus acidilactici]|nr:N-acetylmuramoyl-L-alanine amidase [Pediococcus acidilactici]
EDSRKSVEADNHHLIKLITLYNSGDKLDNYQVLRDNRRPAILIEGGYINTRDDFKLISSASYPQKVATAVRKGLENYLAK